MSAPHLLPAHQLIALYRDGSLSPVDVAKAVIARIEQVNPSLNAFCLVDAERALDSARLSEQRWQAHRSQGADVGALEGVPVSIKDLILTRSWPTLRGSRTIDPFQVWEIDAPVTARLREAGAVLLGKTTTPEFGCKAETNSPLYGISRNPWDVSRTTGGSSGGAAAAVAAGCGPLAVGTDGAGSVRIPAAFCGNVGLKPSFGRVPAYPLSPFGTVAHLGPHTMSVKDAALMLNVMKQPDARDWFSLPQDVTDVTENLEQGIQGLRVAYSPTLGYAKVHPDVAQRVEDAVRVLQDLGAKVEQCDPGFTDPIDISVGLWVSVVHQLWTAMSPQQQSLTDPDFQAQAEQGAQYTFADIHRLQLRRAELGSMMRQFMQR
ncbi:MAG: amidase family protein, partial [Betaproteobacteria bacterium]